MPWCLWLSAYQVLHLILTSALQGENHDSPHVTKTGTEAHLGETASCLSVFRTTGLREHTTHYTNKINKMDVPAAQNPPKREVIPTVTTILLWS